MERHGHTITDNNAFLMATGNGSRIEIHASDNQKSSWTKLDGSVSKNSNSLTLSEITGWEKGDKIVISSTGRDWRQSEERVISSISEDGRTIFFEEKLEHFHHGEMLHYNNGLSGNDYSEWVFDARAEVGLLSRNVKIQGDADSAFDGYGGHTMAMEGAKLHVSGVEFDRMGQEGLLGKYPIHWHLLEDASGQYITHSSIHGSFNKGITVHGTQNLWIEENVVYDTIGHGYFLEDGSEFGNVFKENLGFGQKVAKSMSDAAIPTDYSDVSTYWITNPNNHVWNNVAAGSDKHGFFYSFEDKVNGLSSTNPQYEGYVPGAQKAGLNMGNTSHSNKLTNLWLAGDTNDDGTFNKNSFSRTPDESGVYSEMLVESFTAYNSGERSIFNKDKGNVFVDLISSDNFSDFFSFRESVVQDSLFIGEAGLNESKRLTNFDQVGFAWYDGGQAITDSHFTNYLENDKAFGVKSGDTMGGRNTIEGVTFSAEMSSENKYSHYNIWGIDGFSNTHGVAVQVVDVDGSITGVSGATLTSAIGNHKSWDFQSTVDSIFVDDWGVFVNEGNVDFAKLRFGWGLNTPETKVWEILRSDGKSVEMGHPDDRVSEVLIVADSDYTYTVRFLDEQMDSYFPRLSDLQEGSSVQITFKDVPIGAVVRGADEVGDQADLESMSHTAFYRYGSDVVVKFFGEDLHQTSVVDALIHPEAESWQDSVWIDLSEASNKPAANNWTTKGSNFLSEVSINPLPDRPASTSDTVSLDGTGFRWSDCKTWGGNFPSETSIVVIRSGETIILDTSVVVAGILIDGGELIVEDKKDLSLSSDWVLVQSGGLFQVGSEENPFRHKFDLTLEGDDPELDIDVTGILNGHAHNVNFIRQPEEQPLDSDQVFHAADDLFIFSAGEMLEKGNKWFRLGSHEFDNGLLDNDVGVNEISDVSGYLGGKFFQGSNGGMFRVFSGGIVDFWNAGPNKVDAGESTSFEYFAVDNDGNETSATVTLQVCDEFYF